MLSIKKKELEKVSFIDRVPNDGRTVFLQPFFDEKDGSFKMFLPYDGKLKLIPAEPVQSCYYAKSIVDKSKDIYLKMIDFVVRHYSFEPVLTNLLRIIRDIVNCGSVVEKYFIFLDLYRQSHDVSVHNLVETDIEYFFGNIRSLYDLLQTVIRDLWKMARRINLPDSFRQMVNKDAESLKLKYDLPEPLIKYYVSSKGFFDKCREIRDRIYHSWDHSGLRGEIQVVFCTDEGFALHIRDPFLQDLVQLGSDIWPTEKIKKNGLVSVLALISYINEQVLENLDAFSTALVQSIRICPPISQEYKVFFRGRYTDHLIRSKEYLEKQWI